MASTQNDRRAEPRLGMRLPVRVQGHDAPRTAWMEMSTTENVCASGASFVIRRPVQIGQVLHLDMPLPKRFRRYDLSEASYHVYAIVRTARGDGRVGVKFLGRSAPKGHEENPARVYRLPGDPAAAAAARAERRGGGRHAIFQNVVLRRTSGEVQEERTVTENLGRGGARVLTSLPVGRGEILDLEELGGGFRTRAEVVNVYVGQDHVPRLNLRFLDAEAPARLIQAS